MNSVKRILSEVKFGKGIDISKTKNLKKRFNLLS